jgi:hypothetical protein
MKIFRLFPLFCWISLSSGALALSTLKLIPEALAEKVVATPITVDQGKIFLPCQFDSFSTTCLLDSGSSFSAVNSEPFDHYPAKGLIRYHGGTGKEISVDKIIIHELKVATLNLKNWPVARLPALPGYLPLIGLDVFSKVPVFFDFKNLQIIINPELPSKLSTVPFISQFGLVLLPVKLGNQELLAAWDTGASYCVVDQTYILNHPKDFSFVKAVQGRDATGSKMAMKLYTIKSLTLGQLTLKDVRVAAMDLSKMKAVYPDFPLFFIGYNVIIEHSWYFDLAHFKWQIS